MIPVAGSSNSYNLGVDPITLDQTGSEGAMAVGSHQVEFSVPQTGQPGKQLPFTNDALLVLGFDGNFEIGLLAAPDGRQVGRNGPLRFFSAERSRPVVIFRFEVRLQFGKALAANPRDGFLIQFDSLAGLYGFHDDRF